MSNHCPSPGRCLGLSGTRDCRSSSASSRARSSRRLRQKDGFTKSLQKAFDQKYPPKQVISKVELAKYINAYDEVYDGKKLVIGPHIVVRGNEKNYAKFINNNLPESIKRINNVYFEDTIAKAILFKEADKRYGTKANAYNIGALKQVVVPYTISLITRITKGQLDLYKIWKNQRVSTELSDFIYDLMKQVNQFILEKSPVSHYIEWAKKEECWDMVKDHEFGYDLSQIKGDLIDSKNPPVRKVFTGTDEKSSTYDHEMGIIHSIPVSLWQKIADWGQESGYLAITYQSGARDIAHKLKYHHLIAESDRFRAMTIYEIVCQHNIELLDEADELAEKDRQENFSTEPKETTVSGRPVNDITLELVQEMVEWDRRRRVLEDWKWKVMDDVAKGKKPFTDRYKYTFYLNLVLLRKNGFPK